MEAAVRVSVGLLQENKAMLMQKINLPLLINTLKPKKFFTDEEIEKLTSEKFTVIERTGYVFQYVYKRGQGGADMLMQCLREEKQHPGHREVVELMERLAVDKPAQSPVLDILDEQMDRMENEINMTTFPRTLLDNAVINFNSYIDVTKPERLQRENLADLLKLIKDKGVSGLVEFIRCLWRDPSPGHEKLAEHLLREVKRFLRQSPLRGKVAQGDKTALLQLERTRELEKNSEQEIVTRFRRYESKLTEEVQLPLLLPHLAKHKVISSEEIDRLNSSAPAERNGLLLSLVSQRGAAAIIKFVDCLKESSEHKELGKLFELTEKQESARKPHHHGKADLLAVLVCMDSYVKLNEEYKSEEFSLMEAHLKTDFKEHRESLETCLDRMGYHVVQFSRILADAAEDEEFNGDISSRTRELFEKHVVDACSKDAIVFIFISGIQFPYKVAKEKESKAKLDVYSGAILMQESSDISRKPLECIRAQDLYQWVELLPTQYITFLIDSFQSHVVAFGKQRQPIEVEIMEDPWKQLTNLHSSVVVYFVKPDPTAMWRQRGNPVTDEPVFGLLTEKFVEALKSWIRRGRPEEVSHRLFYEALSFHWHRRGRIHLLYNPVVQGDVDRGFLGKLTYPYQQVFRADLLEREAGSNPLEMFNLRELQVATGTMAGLIKGNELEVFHILRPEECVRGRVTKAHQLSSIVEVVEDDVRKLATILSDIYEKNEDGSKDRSTKFVFTKKKFPLHQREEYAVFLEDLTEGEAGTIKEYINRSSQLLSVAVKVEGGRMVVRKDGQFYSVEDRPRASLKREEVAKVKVKKIQQVKTMLEMMAWYKYVKRLKQHQKAPHLHMCHMTCEKPLLSRAFPLSAEFQIKCTSQMVPYPPSEAILQFEEPKFWVPGPQDRHPILEVEFQKNHIFTSIEIRGDAEEEKFVQQALVCHQKLVWAGQQVEEGATRTGTHTIDLRCQEGVRYITISPEQWAGDGFSVSMKIKHSILQKGTADVEGLTVMNWQFVQQRGIPWSFTPLPDRSGLITLDSPYHWLTWRGSTHEPVIFDLGVPLLLERIEITSIREDQYLDQFSLKLLSAWYKLGLPEIRSVWPMKHEFPQPLVASNVQLLPQNWVREVKVQLQLYGNKEGEHLVVEENDILTLYFTNTSHSHLLFVYLFCLEETGMVQFVFMEVVEREKSCKKLLRAYIPEGYEPPSKQITDTYKVFVSPKKMYLEPFLQRSLTNYHRALSYSICSYGHRPDVGRDELWYEYEFEVVVKKASRR